MIPFIVLAIAWIVVITSEIIQRPVFRRRSAHLLFPIAFVTLAALRITLALHTHFTTISTTGSIEPYLYAEDGLVFTRATLILVGAAIVSFLPAVYFVGFSPQRQRTSIKIHRETE